MCSPGCVQGLACRAGQGLAVDYGGDLGRVELDEARWAASLQSRMSPGSLPH